jgi:hypothetical protein
MKRAFRLVLAAALLVLSGFVYGRFVRPPSAEELQRLRDECLRLDAEVGRRTAAELSGVPRTAIVIGIPSRFAERLASDMVVRLAPEIRLTLRDLKVHQEGEIHGRILLGRSRLGRFTLSLDLDEIDARLRPGSPRLTIGGDRLKVSLPVSLAAGSGRGRLRFRWDGHGVAGAICGDVEIAGAVGGGVVPATYTLEGAFQLSARGSTLVAHPVFEDAKLTIRIEPSASTWRMVDDAIRRQGVICRRALAVANVHDKIHALVGRGFPVTLPGRLLHEVRFPATMEGSVAEGGTDRFAVTPVGLTYTHDALWYGAEVTLTKSAVAAEPPATPPAAETASPP